MQVTRPDIQKLPQEIVRLIAAGEVIERPASVVKELIENSLDAGSKNIEIRLESGGCVEADLESIFTLGFRGEALYSIAAASDVILSTRYTDEDAGTRLTYESGEKKVETIPWPGGTQVESIKLFHSTPARRKFLRSDSAEFSRVASLVSSYALAYPDVSWKLTHNGRESLRTPGTGNLDDALVAVYGVDAARKMIRVDFPSGPVRISGAISSFELTRARRTDQLFFLNGRLIKDPSITSAFERPYMDFLAHGRRPMAILKIECDRTEVDVNVHPHKSEVRLANPRMITSAVYHAVDNSLKRQHPLHADNSPANVIDESEVRVDEQTGEVYQKDFQTFSQPSTVLNDRVNEREWAIREPKNRHTSDWPVQEEEGKYRPFIRRQRENVQHKYPSFDEIVLDNNLPPEGNAIQFANTYLIYNQGKAVYLIDQHNLHERILYEEFTSRERKSGQVCQTLLFPLQVKLPVSLAGLVTENKEMISELGFEVEEFSDVASGGEQAFVLRSIPQSLKEADPVRAFTDIIEKASENEDITEPGGFRRAFTVNLACKSAIKAGQKLTEQEISYLIGQIKDGTYYTCPHGRPTIIRLDEDWFQRVFKRSQR
ncbi:MAG: DNA mismatch repair endonuclease MutL [bacterium]|nr:DNA mismatch repair endonuclease MutL [bacterium]